MSNGERLADPTNFPGKRLVSAKDIIEANGDVEALLTPDLQAVIPTGFKHLDDYHLNGGLRPNQFVVLAARPGVGKTSLADNIAVHVARQQKCVKVFSLEMSREEWLLRTACSIGLVDSGRYDKQCLEDTEKVRLAAAFKEIKALPLYIDDKTDLTLEIMQRELLHSDPKADMVILDYLQLLCTSDNRYAEVSRLSRGLKLMAKQFKIPFVVLCQLNRNSEQGKADAVPQVHHLRDSGSIEQDADIVMILFEMQQESPEYQSVGLSVGKNRKGRRGLVPLRFEGQYTRFTEAPLTGDLTFAEKPTEKPAEDDRPW